MESLTFQCFYRPQRGWGKVIFSEACVNNSVHRGGVHGCTRGACMVAPGGHMWFYLGGMRGFIWGACMVLCGGACMVLFSRGACMVLFSKGGMHGFFSFFGYNEIRSMSGWYTSYWNAFLFAYFFIVCKFLLYLKHYN